MRKLFTLLIALMALCISSWAQLSEENHVMDLGTHGIGEIVTVPELEGVVFHNSYEQAPLPESAYTQGDYSYVRVKVTDKGWTDPAYYWQYELAGIWCMNNGEDEIHLTRYEFDEYGSLIKQHNYTITITVAGGMVEVGTWEPWCSTETPDATVLKDTTIHYGESYYDENYQWHEAPIENFVGFRYVLYCNEINGEMVKSWYCVSPDDITVTSSDPTVVSVEWNEMGRYHEIKGLKRGQATITVSTTATIDPMNPEPQHVAKSVSYKVTVTGDAGPNIGFYQNDDPLTEMTLDGSYDTPYYWPVVREDGDSYPYSGTLNVTSSNPAVATINDATSAEVHFTFAGYGTTIITATVPGDDTHDDATASFTLTYEDPYATDMYFTDYEGNRIDTMNVGTDENGNPVYPYYNSGNYFTGARLVIKQHRTGDDMTWANVTIAPEDEEKAQVNYSGRDANGWYTWFECLALGETDIVARFEGDTWDEQGGYWVYSPATARLHINYVNTYRKEASLHFMDGYVETTSYSHIDSDCAHRGISFSMPQFDTWLKDETTGNTVYTFDPLPLTVTSSDESVVQVSYDEDTHFIACDPKGYGTATITVTFAGDDTYAEATGTISYSFIKNTTPMHECILVDKNGDPVTSIVATEGDLIDAPDIVRADGEELCYTYLAMATTTNRSRWRLKQECSCWDYFYPKNAGLDTIVFTYRRESFFDDNEHDYWAYRDQAIELRIPVQINPLITPIGASAQMNMNPAVNANMAFSNTENDFYNLEEDQLEIQSVVDPVALQLAIDSMAAGTKDWNDLLPGATTFNVEPGNGKLNIQCETTAGYELKVLIRGHGTVSVSQPSMGIAEVDYDVDEVTTVLIYLAATSGGSSAPRRAPAATKDAAPKAIIKAISVIPMVEVTAKPDPENGDVYYSTFYDSEKKYQLPAGTEAYVAELNTNELLMTKIAENGQVIPAGNAVILKSEAASVDLIATDDAPVSFSATNDLHGVDFETAAPANCYVLSGHSTDYSVTGVGFYEFSGMIPAHKAYLTISGGAAYAPKKLRFVFNNEQQATGIDNAADGIMSEKRIENGQFVIIKNGVRYNAQGQIVK